MLVKLASFGKYSAPYLTDNNPLSQSGQMSHAFSSPNFLQESVHTADTN